jgi:hypothetical protein
MEKKEMTSRKVRVDRKNPDVEAYDILVRIEKKTKPLSFCYKGFPVWLALRQSIHLFIANKLEPSHNINRGSVSRVKRIWSYIGLLLNRSRFTRKSVILNLKDLNGKYLVRSTEMCKKLMDSKYQMNIFVDPLRLHDTNGKIVGIESISTTDFKKDMPLFPTLKAYDVYLLRVLGFAMTPIISLLLRDKWGFDNEVANELRKVGIGKSLIRNLVVSFIVDFELMTRYWGYVFRRCRPELVAVASWYPTEIMLMLFTANKVGIPTVELVHGSINKEHTGYIFKNVEDEEGVKDAIPRYVVTHGKYQKALMIREGTLWERAQILDLGFPWIDYSKNNMRTDKEEITKKLGIPPGWRILTITSQEPMQLVLKRMLSKLVVQDGWNLIVKVHPCEASSWRKVYADVINKRNVKFVTEKDINLYCLLNISDAHASFFSSVLWEAPAFGISNYIIDYSTKEMVRDLEELGLAKVSSISDIFFDDFIPAKKYLNNVFSNLDGTSSHKILRFFDAISCKYKCH